MYIFFQLFGFTCILYIQINDVQYINIYKYIIYLYCIYLKISNSIYYLPSYIIYISCEMNYFGFFFCIFTGKLSFIFILYFFLLLFFYFIFFSLFYYMFFFDFCLKGFVYITHTSYIHTVEVNCIQCINYFFFFCIFHTGDE